MPNTAPLTADENLAAAKERLSINNVVVLCGSMRFADQIAEVAIEESVLRRALVLKPDFNMKQPHPLWADPAEAEALKARLDDQHRQKIRLANRVIVVGDYAGDSTRGEIVYAYQLRKPIRFTSPALAAEFADLTTPTRPDDGLGRVMADIIAERARQGDGMREAIIRAIHHYDYDHGLSGNGVPSKHHQGEADAVLAVRDAEMERLLAERDAALGMADADSRQLAEVDERCDTLQARVLAVLELHNATFCTTCRDSNCDTRQALTAPTAPGAAE